MLLFLTVVSGFDPRAAHSNCCRCIPPPFHIVAGGFDPRAAHSNCCRCIPPPFHIVAGAFYHRVAQALFAASRAEFSPGHMMPSRRGQISLLLDSHAGPYGAIALRQTILLLILALIVPRHALLPVACVWLIMLVQLIQPHFYVNGSGSLGKFHFTDEPLPS